MNSVLLAAALALPGLSVPAVGSAVNPAYMEEGGARFARQATLHGQDFVVNGWGDLRFARLLRIYSAALYLEPGVESTAALDDVAKRIEVVYHVPVYASLLRKYTGVLLRRQFSDAELESVWARVEEVNALWRNGHPGDRCALTYLPGRGTELTVNGESKGWIAGADFARVYFTIWLGERPACPRLKKALLGPEAG